MVVVLERLKIYVKVYKRNTMSTKRKGVHSKLTLDQMADCIVAKFGIPYIEDSSNTKLLQDIKEWYKKLSEEDAITVRDKVRLMIPERLGGRSFLRLTELATGKLTPQNKRYNASDKEVGANKAADLITNNKQLALDIDLDNLE